MNLNALIKNSYEIESPFSAVVTNEPTVELRIQQACKYPLSVYNLNECSFCKKTQQDITKSLPRCTRCYRSAYCNKYLEKNIRKK